MESKVPTEILSLKLVQQLPKVELHAHLSGSIDQEKLNELLKRQNKENFVTFDCLQDFGTVTKANEKCFNYFDAVSKVVTDLTALRECTQHVLERFASENCIYLELRTEPKAFARGKTSAEQYVETIQECITQFNSPVHHIHVRLCLSIKRDYNHTKTIKFVVDKINQMIAISKKYTDLIVGIDICGNPMHDTIITKVLPALLQCKESFKTLPITFHIGEMENDGECDAVIGNIKELNIRRLGHVITLKEHHIDEVNAIGENGYELGIELCPTSNQVLAQWRDMKEHHFGKWWSRCASNLLFSINTDDRGLFSCDLSTEIYKVAASFGLSIKDLCDIQKQSIQSSFFSNKQELVKRVDLFYADKCCLKY